MRYMTDDLRIKEIKELAPPSHLLREYPCDEKTSLTVFEAREAIHRILHGEDDRIVVVIGPCSIHDPQAALDYARRLKGRARASEIGARNRDARLLREAAHDGRLEGIDQRSRPRRQLSHQPRIARGT